MLVSEDCPPRAERLLMHRLLDRPPTLLSEIPEEAESWLELEQEYDAKLSCGEKDAALNPMSIFISCSVAADIISEGILMLVECFFLACLL
jgi:hypothetical protein